MNWQDRLTAQRALLLAGCLGGLAPQAALAADQASAPSAVPQAAEATVESGANDIVVTARRQAERLLDVPLAVSAASGETLKARNVTDIMGITKIAPGVRLATSQGAVTLTLMSRGQTNANVDPSLDLSVGVYIDDVYASRPFGLATGLVDIAQVQVLRGPQGTLFGRNTTGGALIINTNDPNFDGLSGNFNFTYGSYNRREETGVLNVPLVNDLLAVRGVIKKGDYDGYGFNLANGRQLASSDSFLGRFKVLLTPTPELKATFTYEWNSINATQPPISSLFLPTAAQNTIRAGNSFGDPTDPAVYLNTDGFRVWNNRDIRGPNVPNPVFAPPISTSRVTSLSGKVEYDFGSAQLTGIVGHRRVKADQPAELDGTPYSILSSLSSMDGYATTGELRLAGKFMDGRLTYQTGFYYYREKLQDSGAQTQNTTSYAVYAQTSVKVTDQLSLTGGIRYFTDTKRPGAITKTLVAGVPTCQVPAALLNNVANGGCAVFYLKQSRVPWLISVDFKPSEDILVYGKVTQGYRSGGYNARAASTTVTTLFGRFDPENVVEYEVGLKSQFFDRRASFNIAAYYDDYKAIQRTSNQIIPPDTQPRGLVSSNAKGRVKGIEVEANFLVTPDLRVGGTYAYTDARYKTFFDQLAGGAIVDRSAEEFPNTAKHIYTLYASYQKDVGIGALSLNVDWFHTTPTPFINSAVTAVQAPFIHGSDYGLLGARAALKLNNGVELAVFGTNLTDRRYTHNVVATSPAIVAIRGAPREVGFSIGYHF